MTDKLSHAGVKGLKWGLRKDKASSSTTSTTDPKRVNLKKAGKIAATVAIGGAVAAGSAYLGRRAGLKQTRISEIKNKADLVSDGARWLAEASNSLNISTMDNQVLANSYAQFVKAR